jgi:hypothetical protein
MFKATNLVFRCCFIVIVSITFSCFTKAMENAGTDNEDWENLADNTLKDNTFQPMGSGKLSDLLDDTINKRPEKTRIGESIGGVTAALIGACAGTVGASLGMTFVGEVGGTSERLPPGSAGANFLTAVFAVGVAIPVSSATYKTVSSSRIWRPASLCESSGQWACPKFSHLDLYTLFGGVLWGVLYSNVVGVIESHVDWLAISPHIWQWTFGAVIFFGTFWRYCSLMASVDVMSHDTVPFSLYEQGDHEKQECIDLVDVADKAVKDGKEHENLGSVLKVHEQEMPQKEEEHLVEESSNLLLDNEFPQVSQGQQLRKPHCLDVTESEFSYSPVFQAMEEIKYEVRKPNNWVNWDRRSAEAAKWGATFIEISGIPMKVFSCRLCIDQFLRFCQVPLVASSWASVVLSGIPGFIPIIGSSSQAKTVINREINQLLHVYESDKWICNAKAGFWGNLPGKYILPWFSRAYAVPFSWSLTMGAVDLVLENFVLNGAPGFATAMGMPFFCFTQAFIGQFLEDEFTDIFNWLSAGAPTPCCKMLWWVDKEGTRKTAIILLDRLQKMKKKLLNEDKLSFT